jgi:NAD(P)-dependent dehydrogenase (short-subunit alcohol dehydrogenase family)
MTQTKDRPDLPVPIKSPIDGRILKLLEQSERVLSPGAPIIDIGYTPKLEIAADFLTADAVKIRPGMDAIIDDWGGDKPLSARVRVVEPGAFTKVSALGVEEQRVNVILDFTQGSTNLADAYRVETRVITWQGSSVLKVPSSAVFRSGEEWAVFTVSDGVAHHKIVKLGGATRWVPSYNVMGVAKASLEASARYLAYDLGPKKIRVNCISAGPVQTLAARGISGFSSMLKHYQERAPLKRSCDPAELGATGVFLASDGAAAITGQVIYVDGGYQIMGM